MYVARCRLPLCAEMPDVMVAVHGALRVLGDCEAVDVVAGAAAVVGVQRRWCAVQAETPGTHGCYDVEFEMRGPCMVRNYWHRQYWTTGDRLVLRATAAGPEATVVQPDEDVVGTAVVVGTPLVGPRMDTARRSNAATHGAHGVLCVLLDTRVVG